MLSYFCHSIVALWRERRTLKHRRTPSNNGHASARIHQGCDEARFSHRIAMIGRSPSDSRSITYVISRAMACHSHCAARAAHRIVGAQRVMSNAS
jgi:hypothetical protein